MARFEVKTQSGKSIFLKDEDEIQRGGEGRIILLPSKTDMVAKIYLPGIKSIDEVRFNQLQVLDKELFVRPNELLYQNKRVAGYTMEYAGKEYFPLSALFNQSFILRNGIDNDYKEKVAQKLINAVNIAHKAGFIIGDLNQFNILVDLAGNVKFIDVDSYETPGHKHTGILLDEIRDYYYQGVVNMNSDYFALSVLLFSMFTFVHPFKGIHQKFKTLAERMIHKVPVFLDDPLLKVPKCYQPIGKTEIQDLFNAFFLNGQRFLLSLNGFTLPAQIHKPAIKTMLDSENLLITNIMENEKIRNVFFNQNFGCIETENSFHIFTLKSKGKLNKLTELKRNDADQVFLGLHNIIIRKKNRLFCFEENALKELKNFSIPADNNFYQLGNILMVIGQGQMFLLYLDDILNNSIRNKRTEIFAEAFSFHSGLIQNTGGVKRIFYNSGKDIASVKVGNPIRKIFQQGNLGIVQYILNKEIVNQYFKINGLNFEIFDSKIDTFIEFGYMESDKNRGFVFEPGENKIVIRRTSDFEIISEIETNLVSQQSAIFYTKAGIIIWDLDKIFLLNQKN